MAGKSRQSVSFADEVRFQEALQKLNSKSPKDVPKMQLQATYMRTKLANMSALNIRSETFVDKLTGIMCKLGKSTSDRSVLMEMIDAGMNVALLNTKECNTAEELEKSVKMVRKVCSQYSEKQTTEYPLAIAIDTLGSMMHTGKLKNYDECILLEKGAKLTLTANKEYKDQCTRDLVYINYPDLVKDLEKGDEVYLQCRTIKLVVEEVGTGDVTCAVAVGGRLSSFCYVHLPARLEPPSPLVPEHDRAIIEFAIEQKLDMLFVTYARNAELVRAVRQIIGNRGEGIKIVAVIEDQEGFRNADAILEAADGLAVSRSYLSVHFKQEKMFLAHKILVAKCNQVGKPVVIMSHFLRSMYYKPRATRPEIADVANAVVEGADCLLLNEETSCGKFPVLCVKNIVAICKEAEGAIWQFQTYLDLQANIVPPTDPITGIAIATVEMGMFLNAGAIIVISSAPDTAEKISSFRPRCPIVAVTRYASVARKLHLYKAVYPVIYGGPQLPDWSTDVDIRCNYGIMFAKSRGFLTHGDSVVIVSGWQHGTGFTNTIRIVYVTSATTGV